MKNTGIEDISIDNSTKNQKRSKSPLIVLLVFIIIIISIIIIYKFFWKKEVNTKQLFFESLSNINSYEIFENNFYKSLFDRLLTENALIENGLTYTSNREISFLKDYEYDKFSINSIINTDVDEKSFINNIIINYSGNEFFKFDIISNKEKLGIFSQPIVNKYIGISYDKFKKIYNIGNPLDYLKENDDIDLSKDELNKYIQKYANIISNQIGEEKFSLKENIVLDSSFGNVDVKEYKLELTNEELKDLLINTLTELKNDEELLNKVLSSKKNINIEIRTNNGEKNSLNIPEETVNVEEVLNDNSTIYIGEDDEGNNTENSTESIVENNNNGTANEENAIETTLPSITANIPENQDQISLDQINFNTNQSVAESILPDGIVVNNEELHNGEKLKIEDIFPKLNKNIYLKNVFKILIGKKISTSVNSFQKDIDELINKIEKLDGDGLSLKLYVSENGIEKIIATLPNESDLEIEFHNNSNQDNTCKITYLYLGEDDEFSFIGDNKNKEYVSNDSFESNEELPIQDKKNGFSIEINKSKNESQHYLELIYNYIESEKINKKISISIKTTGDINSKVIKNDILLRNSGSEKDELIVENSIKFDEEDDIPEITSDNMLLLDDLSEEDESDVLKVIMYQIKRIQEEKKREAELIDTNNQKYLINNNFDNISSHITYDEAKNVLIDKISNMMRESIDRNENFTLHNLEDLEIDGYNVSTTVNEENAKIVIDIYTFNINSNFELTDAN